MYMYMYLYMYMLPSTTKKQPQFTGKHHNLNNLSLSWATRRAKHIQAGFIVITNASRRDSKIEQNPPLSQFRVPCAARAGAQGKTAIAVVAATAEAFSAAAFLLLLLMGVGVV